MLPFFGRQLQLTNNMSW